MAALLNMRWSSGAVFAGVRSVCDGLLQPRPQRSYPTAQAKRDTSSWMPHQFK